MLTKEQLRIELVTTLGRTWAAIAADPGRLWEHIPLPALPVQFDPLSVSADPGSELWCAGLLGLQDEGYLGLAGFNPPELPVFFTIYHHHGWQFWAPTRHNSFNPRTNTAYGTDPAEDHLALGEHAYPWPGDAEKLGRHIRRHFARLHPEH